MNKKVKTLIILAGTLLIVLFAVQHKLFDTVIDEDSSSAEESYYFERAIQLFKEDQFDQAAQMYEKVIQFAPNNMKALIELGDCYFEMGRSEEAAKLYRKVSDINPKDCESKVRLAYYYRQAGDYSAAQKMIEGGITIDPTDKRFYLEFGNLYQDQQLFNEAEKMYRKAIELDPTDTSAYVSLRWLLELERSSDKAKIEADDIGREMPEIEIIDREMPSIIIISIDTLRADRLTCYGNKRPTSPVIDDFAREGVLFENVISQSPWTTPSHMSIFTAMMPDVHLSGINVNKKVRLGLLSSMKTMPELLKRLGYFTVGIHGGGNVDAQFGFDQGFDYYRSSFNIKKLSTIELPMDIEESLKKCRQEEKPLFLFLHHYYCHSPYVFAGEKYRRRFLEKAINDLPVSPTDLDPENFVGSFWQNIDLSRVDHKKHVLDLYDGAVAYSDHLFEEIIQLLKKWKYYDNSLIILLSDHGEEFYEHGGHGHTNFFIEHLHVPLIIKFPRGQYADLRIEKTIRLVDLMPTIFEYIGIPIREKFQGISFLSLLTQKGNYDPLIVSYSPNARRVRLAKDGFVYLEASGGGLFNTVSDPDEQNDLSDEKQVLFQEMSQIANQVKGEKKNYLKLMMPVSGENCEPPVVNRQLEEQLRGLGYIN